MTKKTASILEEELQQLYSRQEALEASIDPWDHKAAVKWQQIENKIQQVTMQINILHMKEAQHESDSDRLL